MKDTLEEIMLWAVAILAIILAVGMVAFICGTLFGFATLIARVAFRLWGV
jgi:hypothetical protein